MTLPQRTLDSTAQEHLDDHNDSLTQLYNDFPLNVTTTPPVAGDTLEYDGAEWVPVVPVAGIPEAPEDGEQYGRQDADWTPVPSVLAYYTLAGDPAAVAGRTLYIQAGTPTMADGDIWFKTP